MQSDLYLELAVDEIKRSNSNGESETTECDFDPVVELKQITPGEDIYLLREELERLQSTRSSGARVCTALQIALKMAGRIEDPYQRSNAIASIAREAGQNFYLSRKEQLWKEAREALPSAQGRLNDHVQVAEFVRDLLIDEQHELAADVTRQYVLNSDFRGLKNLGIIKFLQNLQDLVKQNWDPQPYFSALKDTVREEDSEQERAIANDELSIDEQMVELAQMIDLFFFSEGDIETLVEKAENARGGVPKEVYVAVVDISKDEYETGLRNRIRGAVEVEGTTQLLNSLLDAFHTTGNGGKTSKEAWNTWQEELTYAAAMYGHTDALVYLADGDLTSYFITNSQENGRHLESYMRMERHQHVKSVLEEYKKVIERCVDVGSSCQEIALQLKEWLPEDKIVRIFRETDDNESWWSFIRNEGWRP